MTRSASKAALFTVLALSAQLVFAQNLVAPRPVISSQPPQPTNAAGQEVEGWVTLRYSVLADGSPADVRVVNVMPPYIDPAPTLQSFAGWTFSPGTSNGMPIDWHNNEIKVTFRTQGGASPTADAFAEGYAAVGELLEAGNLDAALTASETLIGQNASRLSELGRALAQRALIYMEREDFHSALEPLQMTTDPLVPMLNGVELFAAVQLRMQVEQELSRTHDAINSYQRLAKGISDPNLDQQGNGLMRIWQEEPQLAVFGRIDGGSWRFDLGRPFFYIVGIQGGNIATLDAECDTRTVTLEFDPNADYGMPESFGDCTLFVQGDEGTTFTLIEALPPAEG